MKSTGIVRRIDDLGRILIPKEVRARFSLKTGAPMEVFLDDDETICLKPYRPLGPLVDDEDIHTFIDGLCKAFGVDIVVADNKGVVLFSSLMGLRGHFLLGSAGAYCCEECSGDKVDSLKTGACTYNGPIKGRCRVYCGEEAPKYCMGAVFVLGDVESAPQIAETIASVMVERFKLYN